MTAPSWAQFAYWEMRTRCHLFLLKSGSVFDLWFCKSETIEFKTFPFTQFRCRAYWATPYLIDEIRAKARGEDTVYTSIYKIDYQYAAEFGNTSTSPLGTLGSRFLGRNFIPILLDFKPLPSRRGICFLFGFWNVPYFFWMVTGRF